MRKLAAITIVVAGFATPSLADTAEDLRDCDGGNLPRDLRIEACTRLIDGGDRTDIELIWIHTRRGGLLYGREDYEAALADFVIVAELDPENWEPFASSGITLLQLERDAEAVIAYDRAIELNPRRAASFYNRGLAHRFLDEYELALADYNQAIKLDPNYVVALLARGRLLLGEDRLDEALADFSVALELAPHDARTYAGRGQILERQGDIGGAIRDYRVGQLLNPNLYAPEERLPEIVPDTEPPDLGRLSYEAPAEGLVVDYIQVINAVQPEIDEMEAAIGDLIFWFIGEPDKPLPLDSDFVTREIGATEDGVTTVHASATFSADEPDTVQYGQMLLPLAIPEAGTAFAYEGAEAIFALAPGETTSGGGQLLLACPPEPDPVATILGCLPGVANIPVGTVRWVATFVGWEYVLVPAGRRLTARILYEEVAETVMFGQTVNRSAETTFWLDPEIDWWIKRERVEADRIQTIEAVAIRAP
jgi:tetratricopeptide (TPR) repeat protein